MREVQADDRKFSRRTLARMRAVVLAQQEKRSSCYGLEIVPPKSGAFPRIDNVWSSVLR